MFKSSDSPHQAILEMSMRIMDIMQDVRNGQNNISDLTIKINSIVAGVNSVIQDLDTRLTSLENELEELSDRLDKFVSPPSRKGDIN